MVGLVALASDASSLQQVHAVPPETVSTLKENAAWFAKRIVIRSEIDQTRTDLDRKLLRLEARAREMTPRRYAQRFVRDRAFEQVVGSALMLCGRC